MRLPDTEHHRHAAAQRAAQHAAALADLAAPADEHDRPGLYRFPSPGRWWSANRTPLREGFVTESLDGRPACASATTPGCATPPSPPGPTRRAASTTSSRSSIGIWRASGPGDAPTLGNMSIVSTLRMYLRRTPKLREPTDLYTHQVTLLDGGELDLAELHGRPTLFVNTASKCGFTPQYEGLQKLHERYADRGLELLGTPSADFADQEYGSGEEIGEFCQRNYGVQFPLTSAPRSGRTPARCGPTSDASPTRVRRCGTSPSTLSAPTGGSSPAGRRRSSPRIRRSSRRSRRPCRAERVRVAARAGQCVPVTPAISRVAVVSKRATSR